MADEDADPGSGRIYVELRFPMGRRREEARWGEALRKPGRGKIERGE